MDPLTVVVEQRRFGDSATTQGVKLEFTRPASQLDELTASFANSVVVPASSQSENFKRKSCNLGKSGSLELVLPTFRSRRLS